MYNKLFTKILDSSIWLAPDPHRLVWITLIAAMDEDGNAMFASAGNLAARARVTREQAEAAVLDFEGPDPDSGDPDNEGRRIERFPGGWHVLNAAKYRDLVTKAIIREQTRERTARYRAKLNGDAHVTQDKRISDASVTPSRSIAVSEEKNTTRKRVPASPVVTIESLCLDGLAEDIAAEYLAHRKRKRANLTPKAWGAIKAEIRKAGLSLDEGITKALARGWTGFEADWLAKDAPRGYQKPDIHSTVAENPGIEATRQLLKRQAEAAAKATPPPAAILALRSKSA